MKDNLPPMPGSDEGTLKRNQYDGFYKKRARDFWGDNSITQIPDEPAPICDHYFEANKNGARCRKCHFGLLGSLQIKKGKLYSGGKKLPL